MSNPITITTMLLPPDPPRIAKNTSIPSVSANSVRLIITNSRYSSGPQSKNHENVLSSWIGVEQHHVNGVSAHKAFRKYDLNGDGTICREEFAMLMMDLGQPSQGDQFESIFNSLDKDSNGYVSEEEFTSWWNTRNSAIVLQKTQYSESLPNGNSSLNSINFFFLKKELNV